MKIYLKQLGISALLICMFSLVKAQTAQTPSDKQMPTMKHVRRR
jgi:hypothetical protein